MKNTIRILITVSFVALIVACGADSYVGEQPNEDVRVLTVAEAVQPSVFGKTIRVQGVVKAVCQTEGCWMSISDGKEYIRMSFVNSSFVVPMDLGGEVIVEGIVSEEVLDAESVQAMGESIGFTPDEVEMIDGDRRLPMMTASGVEFLD